MSEEKELINVYGVCVYNLKDIDVEILWNSLMVIIGLSGSGKLFLVFDIIFVEGQWRYIEIFFVYVCNFLGGLECLDVDKIIGFSLVIFIEQKMINKNFCFIVGIMIEIYDYFCLFYVCVGVVYFYFLGEKMVKYIEEQIIGLIYWDYQGKKIFMFVSLVCICKGYYKEFFE